MTVKPCDDNNYVDMNCYTNTSSGDDSIMIVNANGETRANSFGILDFCLHYEKGATAVFECRKLCINMSYSSLNKRLQKKFFLRSY